jgi:threonine dehydratase
MKNIKKITLYAIMIILIAHHCQIYTIKPMGTEAVGKLGEVIAENMPSVIEASATLGLEAAEKLAPVLDNASTVIGVGVIIYGTVQVVAMTKDAYNYFNPDEEKKERINAARKKNQYYEAERGLRNCLMSNANKPRNQAGRPTICEDFARALYMIAGKEALDEMTTNFKDAYQD